MTSHVMKKGHHHQVGLSQPFSEPLQLYYDGRVGILHHFLGILGVGQIMGFLAMSGLLFIV